MPPLLGASLLPLDSDGGSGIGPLAIVAVNLSPVLLSIALLAFGQMMAQPFVMELIPILSRERLFGTYYGFYSVASAIGERLHRLATRTQLLVVTHSPQVAARGAAHLLIAKSHDGTVTRTGVRALSDAERREEIARMLSGATITDEARAQAERLLETA